MKAYFATGILGTVATAASVQRSRFPSYDLSNYFSNTFPVFYPSYQHDEEPKPRKPLYNAPPVYNPYYAPAPPAYVDLDARCARVDFDWNYLGIEGTLDFYQPHHAPTLVDGSFKDL